MNIVEIRKMTGMSQGEFAKFFDISVRTLQDWEQGRRVPPTYIPGMMLRILKYEFFMENGNGDVTSMAGGEKV